MLRFKFMKKILCTVILSLLLNGNAFANSVSEYLKDGYKLHSVNLSADSSALIYHLISNSKKDKKAIFDLKKEKNSTIVSCIIDAKSGKTIKCYKPE